MVTMWGYGSSLAVVVISNEHIHQNIKLYSLNVHSSCISMIPQLRCKQYYVLKSNLCVRIEVPAHINLTVSLVE